MKGFSRSFIFKLLFLLPVSILFSSPPAWSANFSVTTVSQLEDALSIAQQNSEDDTISIAAGTYDVSGGIAVYLARSTAPVENFALTIEGAGPDQTILDGGNVAQVLSIGTSIQGGAFDDPDADITIRGLRLQNGLSQGPAPNGSGGGLYIRTAFASVTVEDVVFASNEANFDGGGLFIYVQNSGGVMISGINASNNQSGGSGAGTYVYSGGNITVLNSTFTNNIVTADNTGGGLFAQSTTAGTVVTVMGCLFTGNEALATDAIAGGSYVETWRNNNAIFVNNTLSGNASVWGGGAYFNSGPVLVVNNTVSGNHATMEGGGMAFEMQGGTANVMNNIVWGNTAVGSGADIMFWDGGPTHIAVLNNNDYGVQASNGFGGVITVGAGNISLDPLFVATADPDPSNWNLHLQASSPAIDAGDNMHLPAGTPTDRDGETRIIDGNSDATATVDMGSDEYAPPQSAPPVTGGGGGGGCSLSQGAAFDPLLLLMLIVGVGYLKGRSYKLKAG